MRLSWYADTGIAVFSIWQGGTCTGTFRLPMDDLPRLMDSLNRGVPAGPENPEHGAAVALGGQRPMLAIGPASTAEPFTGAMTELSGDQAGYQVPGYGTSGGYDAGVAEPTYLSDYRNQQYGDAQQYGESQQYGDTQQYGDAQQYGEPQQYGDTPGYGAQHASSPYPDAQPYQYTDQAQAGSGYTGQDYSSQNYSGQDYSGQGYAAQEYPAQGYDGQGGYGAHGYADQGYPAQAGQEQAYQAPEYQPDPGASYLTGTGASASLSAPVADAPAAPPYASAGYPEAPGYQDAGGYADPGYSQPADYGGTGGYPSPGYADAGAGYGGGAHASGGYQADGYGDAHQSSGYEASGYTGYSAAPSTGYNGGGYDGYGDSYNGTGYAGDASASYPEAQQSASGPSFSPSFSPHDGGYGADGYPGGGYAAESGYPGEQSYGYGQYPAGYPENPQAAAYPGAHAAPSFTPAGQGELAQPGYWDDGGDPRDREIRRDSREQGYPRPRY